MIGISADRLGATCSASPSKCMEQRPEGVGANRGKRSVDGGDGLIDDGVSASLSSVVAKLCRRCVQANACPLCTHSSVLSWPVWGMPKKVDSIMCRLYP